MTADTPQDREAPDVESISSGLLSPLRERTIPIPHAWYGSETAGQVMLSDFEIFPHLEIRQSV